MSLFLEVKQWIKKFYGISVKQWENSAENLGWNIASFYTTVLLHTQHCPPRCFSQRTKLQQFHNHVNNAMFSPHIIPHSRMPVLHVWMQHLFTLEADVLSMYVKTWSHKWSKNISWLLKKSYNLNRRLFRGQHLYSRTSGTQGKVSF